MKYILIVFVFLSSAVHAQKKWNYKIGWVTPIPFYLQTKYTVDVSSALFQVKYSISDKINLTGTTGYLRFRPNDPEYDLFSNVPVMIGGTYDLSDKIYLGISTGPSLFNENTPEIIRIVYSPYIGMQAGRWSIDLSYFNWEEVPDEANSLVLCLAYNF